MNDVTNQPAPGTAAPTTAPVQPATPAPGTAAPTQPAQPATPADPNAQPALGTADPNAGGESLEEILNGVTIQNEPAALATPTASPTQSAAPAQPAAPATPSGEVTKADLDKINARLDAEENARALAQVNADISKAVEHVSAIATNVDKNVIKGLLMVKASEDPRFDAAFENRGQDPVTWNKILDTYGAEIHQQMSVQVDPNVANGQQIINNMNAGGAAAPVVSESDQALMEKNDTEFMREFNKLAQG